MYRDGLPGTRFQLNLVGAKLTIEKKPCEYPRGECTTESKMTRGDDERAEICIVPPCIISVKLQSADNQKIRA